MLSTGFSTSPSKALISGGISFLPLKINLFKVLLLSVYSKISLSNIEGTNPCKVDVYIEKKLVGKFYLFKDIKLAIGSTFVYEGVRFNNKAGEFGLYIKLTKSASESPAVDVILS